MGAESEGFLLKIFFLFLFGYPVIIIPLELFHKMEGFSLFLWILPIMLLPILLIWSISLRKYMDEGLDTIQKHMAFLEDSSHTWSSLEDDLIRIGTIYRVIQGLISRKKFTKFFYSKGIWNQFDAMYELISKSILWILKNLQTDLDAHLIEQQKTLKQAQIEVEKNMHWTTELNQVSELQKARLDRQIEQFETLQKVLVKV